MHADHYKDAKKKGLRELLRQMQGLMSKGKGDQPMDGAEVAEAVADAGDAAEAVCEECGGSGCEHCEAHEVSDEPAEVNAHAEDDSEHEDGDDEDGDEDSAEPDFKQSVRDYLSGKQKRGKPSRKSLVIRQVAVGAALPKAEMPRGKPFPKGDKKRA